MLSSGSQVGKQKKRDNLIVAFTGEFYFLCTYILRLRYFIAYAVIFFGILRCSRDEEWNEVNLHEGR